MKRLVFPILLIAASAIFGASLYESLVDSHALGLEEIYEFISPQGKAAIENGKVNVESGALLKIRNFDQLAKENFSLRFQLNQIEHYKFFMGFENGQGGRIGEFVEKEDPDLNAKDRFSVEFTCENTNCYLLLDDAVRSFWENVSTDARKFFVIDGQTSQLTIDNLQLADLQGKIIFEDDFLRGGPFKIYLVLCGLIVAICIILIYLAETRMLFRIWPYPRRKQPASFALSLALCTITGFCGRWIIGFDWLLPFSIALFFYLRLRFMVTRSGALDPSKTKSAAWAYLLLVVGAIGLGALIISWRDGIDVSRIAMQFILLLLCFVGVPLLFKLSYSKTNLKQSFAVFGKSAFPLALALPVTLLIQLGEMDSISTLLAVFGLAIYFFPVRTNIQHLKLPNVWMLSVVVLILFTLDLNMSYGPNAGHFRPMNIGKGFEENELLFWAPKNFFPTGSDFMNMADISVQKINFRSGRISREKPENTFRIIVMGGSNVWGDGIEDPQETFSGQLALIANQHTTGPKFEVVNAGVKGYNSFQIRILYEKFVSLFEADLVILYMGRNDVAGRDGIYTFKELHEMANSKSGRAIKGLQKTFQKSAIYNGLTSSLVEMRHGMSPEGFERDWVKNTMPPEDYLENVDAIVSLAKENGSKVLLGNEYWAEPLLAGKPDHRLDAIQAAMATVSQKQDVPLVDVYGIFEKNYEIFDIVFRHDVVHLNEYGHRILAELLFDTLVDLKMIPANPR